MKKILWLDTETSGTDALIHSIIDIAGIIDIDGKVVEQFDFKVRPHLDFEIDEATCAIHGYSVSDMISFPDIPYVHSALKKLWEKYVDKFNKEDKFLIGGQNCKFDLSFLSQFFVRQKDVFLGSYIDYRKRVELYDITNAMRSLGFIKSDSLSLAPLCKEFCIDLNAHNALSDITATRELYYTIINNLEWKWRGNEKPNTQKAGAPSKKLHT